MTDRRKKLLWVLVFCVLTVFAVPWFFWGNSTVYLGLPVWVWWHIGWMVLTAIVFGRFVSAGWDLFVEEKVDE